MDIHLLKCSTCNYAGLGLRGLRRHRKQAHQAPIKDGPKKQCEICGTEVGNLKNLKDHLRTVHGEHSHKCDLCEYTCTNKGALTKHRKGHFLTLQECPICQKKVKQLKRHAMRCMSKNKAKRYPCNQCDKTFAFANGLKTHVNHIHRQIKDFHCDICDYKTYTITNLRIHTSKVHDKESLERQCPVCKIKTSCTLDKHLKIYHFEYYQELKKEKQSEEGSEEIDEAQETAS